MRIKFLCDSLPGDKRLGSEIDCGRSVSDDIASLILGRRYASYGDFRDPVDNYRSNLAGSSPIVRDFGKVDMFCNFVSNVVGKESALILEVNSLRDAIMSNRLIQSSMSSPGTKVEIRTFSAVRIISKWEMTPELEVSST